MQFWALITDSFRESRDRKIFWVMLFISVATAAAMACVKFEPAGINILFGLWTIDTNMFGAASDFRTDLIAGILVDGIMDVVLGSVGIILAIVATAGFIPAMMERGGVDVLTAKPMSRSALLLGKYLGTMVFMLFHAGVFVGLTFLVAGFRWGAWIPGCLWTIPLIVLLFSYLYCVSVLVAVLWRSTVAVVLITLGAWMLFVAVQQFADMFTIYPSWQENTRVHRAVRAARWVVPKTQDVTLLARKWAGAAPSEELIPDTEEVDDELLERASKAEADRMALSPILTIGSSLGFEAFILLLAAWRFSRRDF